VTSLQALYLLNDEFIHRQADQFAQRIRSGYENEKDRLAAAFELALGRPATELEARAATALVAGTSGDGWAALARVLFRMNEFLYLD
jgi:hypothetical protein